MTEKIIIAQEQADAIEVFLAENDNDREHFINWFGVNREYKDSLNDNYKPFADLSYSDLAKALLVGYEIEQPPIKLGNWAKYYRKSDGMPFIGMIVEIIDGKAWAHWNDTSFKGFIHVKDLTKMTTEEIEAEKERRKWAGIEEGDVLALFDSYTIGTFVREIDGETIVVNMSSGPCIWRKEKVVLYAKKVGASK